MKTRAAVALESGKQLEIMEVNLELPRKGEVLVEIKATGLCHTDDFTRSGDDPEGIFPAILGHEGAGVVVDVGEVGGVRGDGAAVAGVGQRKPANLYMMVYGDDDDDDDADDTVAVVVVTTTS